MKSVNSNPSSTSRQLSKGVFGTKKLYWQMLMFLGGILLGLTGLFIYFLSNYSSFLILAFRGLFALFGAISFLLLNKSAHLIWVVLKHVPLLIFFQTFSNTISILFYFIAIINIGAGFAGFLAFSGPLFAVLIVWALLRRKPDKRDWVGFVIVLIGIFILSAPWKSFQILNMKLGVLAGLTSGIFFGFSNALKIKIFHNLEQNPTTTQLIENQKTRYYLTLAMVAIESLMFFFAGIFPSIQYFNQIHFSAIIILIIMGIVGLFGFSLSNYAIQKDHAGDVMIFSYSEPITGSIVQTAISGYLPWELIVGGVFILLSNIIVALKKNTKTE